MTPAARVAAAIEVLDDYLSGTPAEQALTGWARAHRFAGSKDRAAIRDHVFDALRRLRSSRALGGGADGRATMIGLLRGYDIEPDSLFTGEGHAPLPLSTEERADVRGLTRAEALDIPDWLIAQIDDSLGAQADEICERLRHRAPVFLRVNAARTSRDEMQQALASQGILTRPVQLSPMALEVTENPRKINGTIEYQDGLIELQDAASQAVIELLDITPGMRVLDFCAGGGGKALAMAARGADVVAHDIAPGRMKDLPARAERAGVRIQCVDGQALKRAGAFDLVLADAPCSGSGSWRRAPHGKWLLSAQKLDKVLEIQQEILSQLPNFCADTGEIAYATCSFLRAENQDQVSQFQSANPAWQVLSDRQFTPLDGADGFYVARLKRK
ncbi:RsmB/NOP family class I SAM-dependent RNA methyltransferase [Aliiroseovarius marinus]|uniref:RsmB/NOP family class I SAM-dependent RNA methyltransferase n=1 Tax=Aliiroseovarius marinus TaxID=2500159 RepID=UPI003D7CB889